MSIESPGVTDRSRYLEIARSDEFGRLRKALRGFVFPMTAAFFVWYALYVLLSAYARGFMGAKLIGNINVALVFGLLQFVSTFLITFLYVRFADRQFDPLAGQLRTEIEGPGAAGSGFADGDGDGTGTGVESRGVTGQNTDGSHK